MAKLLTRKIYFYSFYICRLISDPYNFVSVILQKLNGGDNLIGAILGDIIGSPFEFDRGSRTKVFPLFSSESKFTDDTVMTVAVAEALLDTFGSRTTKYVLQLFGQCKSGGGGILIPGMALGSLVGCFRMILSLTTAAATVLQCEWLLQVGSVILSAKLVVLQCFRQM